jgi:hypothetical protein
MRSFASLLLIIEVMVGLCLCAGTMEWRVSFLSLPSKTPTTILSTRSSYTVKIQIVVGGTGAVDTTLLGAGQVPRLGVAARQGEVAEAVVNITTARAVELGWEAGLVTVGVGAVTLAVSASEASTAGSLAVADAVFAITVSDALSQGSPLVAASSGPGLAAGGALMWVSPPERTMLEAFVVANRGSLTFGLSTDNFGSFTWVTATGPLFLGPALCPSSAAASGVRSAHSYEAGIIFNTPQGLLFWDRATRATSVLLARCIDLLEVEQAVPGNNLAGSFSAVAVEAGGRALHLLSGQPARAAAAASLTVTPMAALPANTGSVIAAAVRLTGAVVLALTALDPGSPSGYSLLRCARQLPPGPAPGVPEGSTSACWARVAAFPLTVPSGAWTDASSVLDPPLLGSAAALAAPQAPLGALRGLAVTGASPAAVVVFGDVVLASSDLGGSFFVHGVVASGAAAGLASLVGSPTGSPLLLGMSASGEVLAAQPPSPRGFSVTAASAAAVSPSAGAAVAFAGASPVRVVYSSSLGGLLASEPLASALEASQRNVVLREGLQCPYTSLVAVASSSPLVTRVSSAGALLDPLELIAQGPTRSWRLPEAVHLDVNGTYSFVVEAKVRAGVDGSALRVHVALENPLGLYPDAVDIRVTTRYVEVLSLLTAEVTLSDLSLASPTGPVPSMPSGFSFSARQLRVTVSGSTSACANPGLTMALVSGCPPLKALRFSKVYSIAPDTNHCSDPVAMCSFFTDNFYPVLELVDEVTKLRANFTHPYRFAIVGAGHRLSEVKDFDPQLLAKSNLGAQTIWTNAEGLSRSVLTQGSGVSWICGPGTPCDSPFPLKAGDSPHYYLKVLARTANVNNDSYCDVQDVFYIKVYGISMGYKVSLTLTFGTLGIILIVLTTAFIFTQIRDAIRAKRDRDHPPARNGEDEAALRAALFG